jgi:hypothetical protein
MWHGYGWLLSAKVTVRILSKRTMETLENFTVCPKKEVHVKLESRKVSLLRRLEPLKKKPNILHLDNRRDPLKSWHFRN